MRFKDFTKLPLWLAALMLAGGLAAYPSMPGRVPVHWGLTGIDRWAPKTLGHVLYMPALVLGIWALMLVAPRFDPKGRNVQRSPQAYRILADIISGFLAFMQVMLIATAFRPEIDLGRFVAPAVGLLFVLLGNWMPRLPQNWTAGVRLPWTLEDANVWKRTNRLGGWLFVGAGAIIIALGLVSTPAAYVFMTVSSLGIVAVLSWYSYVLWRRDVESGVASR
jgi:uncharacterized membrane protein